MPLTESSESALETAPTSSASERTILPKARSRYGDRSRVTIRHDPFKCFPKTDGVLSENPRREEKFLKQNSCALVAKITKNLQQSFINLSSSIAQYPEENPTMFKSTDDQKAAYAALSADRADTDSVWQHTRFDQKDTELAGHQLALHAVKSSLLQDYVQKWTKGCLDFQEGKKELKSLISVEPCYIPGEDGSKGKFQATITCKNDISKNSVGLTGTWDMDTETLSFGDSYYGNMTDYKPLGGFELTTADKTRNGKTFEKRMKAFDRPPKPAKSAATVDADSQFSKTAAFINGLAYMIATEPASEEITAITKELSATEEGRGYLSHLTDLAGLWRKKIAQEQAESQASLSQSGQGSQKDSSSGSGPAGSRSPTGNSKIRRQARRMARSLNTQTQTETGSQTATQNTATASAFDGSTGGLPSMSGTTSGLPTSTAVSAAA